MNNKKLLGQFILSELSEMKDNICSKFEDNMRERSNNPFVCIEDNDMSKYMALGRSFDSQLGNRLQNIIFYIARLKYGDKLVPNLVSITVKDQDILLTTYSIPFSNSNFRETVLKNSTPFRQVISIGESIDEERAREILKLKKSANEIIVEKYEPRKANKKLINTFDHTFKKFPVDLIYFDNYSDTYLSANTFEIKLGGNLDTKNAKSNKQEVKYLEFMFKFLEENHSYFATCYKNSDSPKGAIFNQLNSDYILIGKEFWNKILPKEIKYIQFIEIFQEAFKNSGLEDKMKSL